MKKSKSDREPGWGMAMRYSKYWFLFSFLTLSIVVQANLIPTFSHPRRATGTWVNQQRWALRRSIYLTLLEKLCESRQALGEVIEAEEGLFDDSKVKKRDYVSGRLQTIKSASVDIRNALDRSGGVLFLSDNALNVLHEYEKAEENRIKALEGEADIFGDVSAEATSWSAYLNHQLNAADIAYVEIIKVAKSDLQIRL